MSGLSKSKSQFNLKVNLVDGSTAVNDIAISGIATEDTILFVGHFSTKAVLETLADITSEVSITSAGNIQLSSTNTTDDLLWVWWIDNSL